MPCKAGSLDIFALKWLRLCPFSFQERSKRSSFSFSRNYQCTNEEMRLAAWCMRRMPGCATQSMGVWVLYRLYSNKLMSCRPSWHWLRQRWCTSEWGRQQLYQTMGHLLLALAIVGRLPLGSWGPKWSPFLTWKWWTIPAWESQCGHARVCMLPFYVMPSLPATISRLILSPVFSITPFSFPFFNLDILLTIYQYG